jgi:hypothetical protein
MPTTRLTGPGLSLDPPSAGSSQSHGGRLVSRLRSRTHTRSSVVPSNAGSERRDAADFAKLCFVRRRVGKETAAQ